MLRAHIQIPFYTKLRSNAAMALLSKTARTFLGSIKLVLLIFFMPLCSEATVLTFDICGIARNENIQPCYPAYGDAVTAATMGSFNYGCAGGWTANVNTSLFETLEKISRLSSFKNEFTYFNIIRN